MALPNMVKHEHYEAHKEEIIADLRSIGRPATRKKWEIPSGTMSQLEQRWISPQDRQELTHKSNTTKGPRCKRKAKASSRASSDNNNFPAFPEFSNEWPESVQLRWLDVYDQLRRC